MYSDDRRQANHDLLVSVVTALESSACCRFSLAHRRPRQLRMSLKSIKHCMSLCSGKRPKERCLRVNVTTHHCHYKPKSTNYAMLVCYGTNVFYRHDICIYVTRYRFAMWANCLKYKWHSVAAQTARCHSKVLSIPYVY